jgi:hypothetical protein
VNQTLIWDGGLLCLVASFPGHQSRADYQLLNFLKATSFPTLSLISPLAPLPWPPDILFITTKRQHQHYELASQSGTGSFLKLLLLIHGPSHTSPSSGHFLKVSCD